MGSGVYWPLRQGEIRILELHPGEFSDSLSGRLHIVSIDFEYTRIDNYQRRTNHATMLPVGEAFWYTALSYTWGAPIFDVQFQLSNKSSIQITTSLAAALRHLRDGETSTFLWIDQICIDQSSIPEKEQQIPLMRSIYSHATNTIIWLGDEGEDQPQIAFDTLEMIHSRLQLIEGEIGPEDFENLHLPLPDAVEWKEVKKLLERPWFTRLWVVQEVILSLSLYVKCARVVVPWDDFALWSGTLKYSGVQGWLEKDTWTPLRQSGLETIFKLSTYRLFTMSHEQQPSLLEGLTLTRYAQASVAKDKIYGVLGITLASILPRYSDDISVQDVFLEAALTAFSGGLFTLLCCVDHDQPTSPSWVPDRTTSRYTESFGYSTKSWALCSASGPALDETGKPYEVTYSLENNNKELCIPGKLVDTIVFVGDTIDHPVIDIDNPTQINASWMLYTEMAKNITSYPTGESIWDAFWQTLVAGKDGSFNDRAPSDYSEILSLIVDESAGQELRLPGQPYSPRRQKGFFTLRSLTTRKPKQALDDMRKAFRAALQYRRFAITKAGYFALVPRGAGIGDRVAIFQRCNIPFILRNKAAIGEENFELIGESYVHGLMKGEAWLVDDMELKKVRLV